MHSAIAAGKLTDLKFDDDARRNSRGQDWPPRILYFRKLELMRIAGYFLLCCVVCRAQTVCPATPQYSPCDLVFDATAPQGLQAEIRSPKQATALVKAFDDGPGRRIIRFTPAEAGTYVYRLNDGKTGQFTATEASRPGWLRAANVHHFASVEGLTLTPHLWMGAMAGDLSSIDPARWKALVDTRAAQHFNHLGITLAGAGDAASFQSPEFFRAAEEKILYANRHGLIVDVAFMGPDGLMNRLLASREARQKWFTYALSRLAAFDVTWQGIEAWESYDNGRELLKEIAGYLTELDPYKHTRSSRTSSTTGALVDDGWLRYRSYETGDVAVGAIEQQVYQYPALSNFSVGVTDTDEFRRRLWRSTVSGQYPGTVIPNEQAAAQMKIWYEFMADSRHWELEPFFDADGFRGLALENVEYIVYVDKPGPVTVNLEDHRYDGVWFNPLNGQSVKVKEVKGKTFTGEPPDRSHDWVLRIAREGTKASMLKSYKFESREIVPQVIEGNPEKVPFEIVEPAGETLSLGTGAKFAVKLKRESKALSQMMYEWTGEVTVDGRSYRVIGSGSGGTFQIPANIAARYPAALHVKVTALNGLGKVYTLDRNYTLNK